LTLRHGNISLQDVDRCKEIGMVQRKDSLKFQKIVAIYALRGDGFSELDYFLWIRRRCCLI
jgi:hypothetical protein